MYQIEKRDFGYHITFSGYIRGSEMQEWVEASQKALVGSSKDFGVLVDMRELKPLPHESQGPMEEGQRYYRSKGMARSAVVVDSRVTKMQFQRIANETGIAQWERYIDASSTPDWEKKARSWLTDAVDPDA